MNGIGLVIPYVIIGIGWFGDRWGRFSRSGGLGLREAEEQIRNLLIDADFFFLVFAFFLAAEKERRDHLERQFDEDPIERRGQRKTIGLAPTANQLPGESEAALLE